MARDCFGGASGINLNGQRSLGEPNKDIIGVGSIAFLVRRTLFEAMSRFRIDFDCFWDVSADPGNTKTMYFAP